jgi:hypothetical protein
LWDMHYAPVPEVEPEYPMTAVFQKTAPAPTSPWAMTDTYKVVLTVDGKTFEQPVTLKMDPRLKASPSDLQEQFDLSWQLYQLRIQLAPIGKKFDNIAEQLTKLRARAAEKPEIAAKLEAFGQILTKFGPPHPRQGAPPSFFVLQSAVALFNEIQAADAAPTAAVKTGATEIQSKVPQAMEDWKKLIEVDLPALNQELKLAGLPQITDQ